MRPPRKWSGSSSWRLALIEPVMHLAIPHMVGEGQVHTGFRIGDTPFFFTAMDSLRSGFESPYATCDSPMGQANAAYFALPHHWVYGILGWCAALIGLSDFIALGLANGLCGGLYLFAAWRLLQALWPERARDAFLLFSLGGGLAGVLYTVCSLLGVAHDAAFEAWFHRFARYELIEGPFIAPALVLPRLYYTLPLALGCFALTRIVNTRVDWKTLLLLAACTYLNARLGPFVLALAWAWLGVQDTTPLNQRIKQGLLLVIPVAICFILVMLQFSVNPPAQENVSELLRRVAWFGSVVTALILFLPVLGIALWQNFKHAPKPERLLLGMAIGYFLTFGGLYVLHQTYYGNWLKGGDTAAALAGSDWALLGALTGAILTGLIRTKNESAPITPARRWAGLVFMALLCISISAWGGGLFMRLMPERCLVLLGIPLALLTVAGLESLGRFRTLAMNGILICGTVSILVAHLFFQGPWGYPKGNTAFAWTHSEVMPIEDAQCIAAAEGTVLVPAYLPPYLGDVIVHTNPGTRTVFGQPTLEFAGVNMAEQAHSVHHFFQAPTTTEERWSLINKWCVDTIYCPSTYPFEEGVLEQLENIPWLELSKQEGDARLYRIIGESSP